ncbi:beta-L-arabinofuranosidase domain-containing protein [Ideonella sp. YS5]|uniref:glycoside hydrolase family 127 protein n=1 Tax=Ideonella sp. YS5 TaxID=3453714 RepID=UPI003EED57F8
MAVWPWLAAGLPLPAAAGQERSAPPPALRPFGLSEVRLLPGEFKAAQERDGEYLLSLQPDRMLHNFRVNAGLPPKAPVYGGWESQEPWVDIRCHGHTLGHYLSACALMWASTGDAAYRQRVGYSVDELAACQAASGRGLVCAFPDNDAQLMNSLRGRPVTGVPWYTLHKVMAGLRDAHVHAGNASALPVLCRLADWIDDTAKGCDRERMQQMLGVEHGGMNEVLADLHSLTGEARYLALAERFNHEALLGPLAEGRDPLDGWHSNTQIPKVIGFARLHALTGQPRYRQAASYFWGRVVDHRSFATGGNGDGEFFFPPGEMRQHLSSAKTMETCSTHNMLRLTRELFLQEPQAAQADFYERALLNGILASQDPASGMFTYFQATRPGYPKLYCKPEHSFWCCTGTGMENHAKYGDSIYFQGDDTLVVNLFIASELNWADKQVRVRQVTRFPDEAGTRLTVQAARPTRFTMRIRHPAWCRQAIVKVNGKVVVESHQPGRYLDVERRWHPGDVVDVVLPMHLHLQPLPGAPDVAALMFGPVVLAARLGTEGMEPGADLIVNERTYGDVLNRPMPLPALAWDGDIPAGAVRRQAGPLSFRLRAAQPDAELELVPFHRIAHERYNLYWQLKA